MLRKLFQKFLKIPWKFFIELKTFNVRLTQFHVAGVLLHHLKLLKNRCFQWLQENA